ncbi:MAG: MopE-related protein [Polyangiales bacterium]
MARRSLRVSWVIALSAAVSVGCASGSTDEEGVAGDTDIGDGFVDGTGDGTGGETSVTPDTGGGDGTLEETDGGDGATDGDGASDASCDPEAGLTISCGVGECTVTVSACSEAGVPQTCKPKDPTPEVCDGKDNNCDGKIDEDLGETTCGKGECTRTQKNCVDGAPKTCTPGTPGTEVCNGKDDDCNDLIDDGFGTITCGKGECQVTVNKCETGSIFHTDCTSVMTKAPSAEVCNGKDDNCDGSVDEGLGTTTCGTGECQRTVSNCVSGSPVTCVPGTPVTEVCDGKDNDCNGTPDDLPVLSCGVGACATTAPACTAGGGVNTCVPKTKGVETCNGIDDDCNGTADDGLPLLTCGIGECKNTVASCVGGTPQTCTPLPSSPEVCDGKDNDCTGAADDAPAATMCPPPSHTATTACTSGTCKTAGCSTGFVDVDGIFSNGCECADSTLAHSCLSVSSTTGDMGTVAVGSTKSSTNNNPILGRDDWYKVVFLNTRTDLLSHPKITFTTNPGSAFELEIVYGTCGAGTPVCTGSEGSATAKQTWEASYTGSLAGVPTDPAWIPILTPLTAGGPTAYTPVTATYSTVLVRVSYRAGAVATCSPYTLQFSN